jgi:hypothetical protein
VLNTEGHVVSTIPGSDTAANGINSPWDMTVFDQGATALLFVSDVGKADNRGYVSRLNLAVSSTGVTVSSHTTIASGYKAQPDAVGFVKGPTGLAYNPTTGTLYVASTLDNAVYAVANAGHLAGSGGRAR